MRIYQAPSPDPRIVVLMASRTTWRTVVQQLGSHTRPGTQIQLVLNKSSDAMVQIEFARDVAETVLAAR